MTGLAEIKATIDQYDKHGWVLRRSLLSPETIAALGDGTTMHPAVEIVEPAQEALWFSRRSLPDREAWELRRLSGSPFALVIVLEDSFDDDEREALLRATEQRLFDGSHPEPISH